MKHNLENMSKAELIMLLTSVDGAIRAYRITAVIKAYNNKPERSSRVSMIFSMLQKEMIYRRNIYIDDCLDQLEALLDIE